MAAVFPAQVTKKPFQGKVMFAVDGTPATVWCFPQASVMIGQSDNIGRPSAIDGAGQDHLESPGITSGSIMFAATLTPDRDIAGFLTAGWGPRTSGLLAPMVSNIIPYGGATAMKATGIWWDRLTLAGQFSEQGTASMVRVQARGRILDFDNFYSAPTLTAPAGVGSNGAGVSNFVRASLTDSQASPTTYGNLRSFSLTLDNRLTLDPGTTDATHRIAEGCTPGPLAGAFTAEQMWSGTAALPNVIGQYPMTLKLPTGDGTHTLSIDLAVSRDAFSFGMIPTDYLSRGIAYSLFGTQPSPNGTAAAGHSFVASYS